MFINIVYKYVNMFININTKKDESYIMIIIGP